MRSRVASETLPCPLITRDTVAVDTCASRATSLRVTPIPPPACKRLHLICKRLPESVKERTPPTRLVQEVGTARRVVERPCPSFAGRDLRRRDSPDCHTRCHTGIVAAMILHPGAPAPAPG